MRDLNPINLGQLESFILGHPIVDEFLKQLQEVDLIRPYQDFLRPDMNGESPLDTLIRDSLARQQSKKSEPVLDTREAEAIVAFV